MEPGGVHERDPAHVDDEELAPEAVGEAVARAVALADEEDLVVVAGSIYVVGAVRAAYSRQAEAQVRARQAAEAQDSAEDLGY